MPPPRRPAGHAPRLPPPPEQYAAVRFPEAGLDLSQPFGLPRVRTTPVGLNVRLHEGLTQRGRGGSRAGLGRFVPAQLPSGAHRVQDLNVVVDPAGVALLGNYDFNPADLYDPSSFGPATSWGVGPLDSQGLPIPPLPTSRNSGWVLRVGGTGVQPNKNDRSGVWINWPTPDAVDVDTPLGGDQLDAVGTDPRTLLPLTGGTYVYNPVAGTVLLAGAGQVLAVTYTPDDTAHYRGGTATVLIDINPLTPLLDWPDPLGVEAGTVLSGTQLDAKATDPHTMATVPGTFVYTPPAGTVLLMGANQPLQVTFTPLDTVRYTTATKTAHINVSPAPRFVQASGLDTGGASGTAVVAYHRPVTIANRLLAWVVTLINPPGSGTETVTVTDSLGNTWTQVGSYSRLDYTAGLGPTIGHYALSLWQTVAGASGTCTVTASPVQALDAHFQGWDVTLAEYSGVSGAEGVAAHLTDAPAGLLATTGTVGVTGGSRRLVGGFRMISVGSFTASAGFVQQAGLQGGLNLVESSALVAAPAAVTAVLTIPNGIPDFCGYFATGLSLF